jgi:hypothetical protein
MPEQLILSLMITTEGLFLHPTFKIILMDESIGTRISQDSIENQYGKKCLSFCQSHNLRILNGGKPGDSLGYYTCFKYNGSSVVDYALVSPSLFKSVMYFSVGHLTPISDYCMIYLWLMLPGFTDSGDKNNYSFIPLQPVPVKYFWDAESAHSGPNL